jgi:hypothetical protein
MADAGRPPLQKGARGDFFGRNAIEGPLQNPPLPPF